MFRILSRVRQRRYSHSLAAPSKFKIYCFDRPIITNRGWLARDESSIGRQFSSQPSEPTRSSFCSKAIPPALVFTVTRREPELVAPAKPTPHESKMLSDIDDQEALRMQVPVIQFYSYNPSMRGRDPVKVIKEAVAQALVHYYPFAGRLREGDARKLIVDCTGEGVMFIEADAGVRLEQFGNVLQPPFPLLHELLYDVPGSGGILNCPLLLIQVTRLECGGFILALRFNHTMADGIGMVQFMTAVSEMARGASAPSVLPVWQRELLDARNPPLVTFRHSEYDDETAHTDSMIQQMEDAASENLDIVQRSFFFGPAQISLLRRRFLPPQLHARPTTFEVLTACIWRCHTIALHPNPPTNEVVNLIFAVTAGNKFNPPLPVGYYGNTLAVAMAQTPAEKLLGCPLSYITELLRKSKTRITEEYMKSVAAFLALNGKPMVRLAGTFTVSDVRHVGFSDVDFGWGIAAYGGLASSNPLGSHYMPISNSSPPGCYYIPISNRGENGILVPMSLPASGMIRFVKELDNMLKDG